jgi:hypothetical protein
LKLPKRATGCAAEASGAVTATTSDGLSAPACSTSHPDALRKLANRGREADAPAVAASATVKAASPPSTRSLMPGLRGCDANRSIKTCAGHQSSDVSNTSDVA